MTPFGNFTTKAKEAVRKAHELAIERGQNHVSPIHLLIIPKKHIPEFLMMNDEGLMTKLTKIIQKNFKNHDMIILILACFATFISTSMEKLGLNDVFFKFRKEKQGIFFIQNTIL